MKTRFLRIGRYAYAVVAMAFIAVATLPVLTQTTMALPSGSLLTSRSIKMSTSVLSAANTTYHVAFNVQTTGNTQAIIVDFCDDSPLVASTTCTLPAGFSITATPAVSGQSSTAGCSLATFTTAAQLNSNQTLELSAASAVNFTTSNCAAFFDLTTVTNPSTANHSFYARIYTYDTTAHATSYARGGSAGEIDYGGVALSTASQITISATVQETMTFCVSGSSITGTCSGLTAPALVIGNGGTPSVLVANTAYAAPAYTQISTNANGGSIVRMKASNACTNGGLSTVPPDVAGGCLSIPGIGSSAVVFPASTANFGMCVAPGAGITAATNYNDTVNSCPTTFNATSKYGMNGANVTGLYGDQVYSSAGAVSAASSSLTFAAEAVNTTPAGVYQGNEALIATGTF